MKKISFFLIVPLVLICHSDDDLFAKGPGQQEVELTDGWLKTMSELKERMALPLQRNETLISENNTLREKAIHLQKSLHTINVPEAAEMKDADVSVRSSNEKQDTPWLEKNLEDLKNRMSQLENEKVILESQLSQKGNDNQTLTNEINTLKNDILVLERNNKTTSSERHVSVKKLESEAENIHQSLEENSRQLESQQRQLEDLENEETLTPSGIQDLRREKTRLESELAEVKLDVAVQKNERNKIAAPDAGELKRLGGEIESLARKNKDLEIALTNLKRKKESAKNVPAARDVRQNNLQDKLRSFEEKNKELQAELSESKEKMTQVTRQKIMVESLLEARSTSKGAKEGSFKNPLAVDLELEGYHYAASGQYEKAIAKYSAAIKEGASKKDMYYNLGFIHQKLGRWNEAADSYRKALVFDSNDQEICLNLSQIYKKLSDKKTSEFYYNKFLEIQPK